MKQNFLKKVEMLNNEQKNENYFAITTAAALLVPLYIFVHEFGHMIVMLASGAKIEDFSIFTAHVTATGGNYSKIGELWL